MYGELFTFQEAPKMFAKDTEVNHEAVIKKLNEIISARGKKGTDRNEQIALLTELQSISNANNLGPAISMKIMFNIVAAIYDYNPNIATCMRSEMWEKYVEFYQSILFTFMYMCSKDKSIFFVKISAIFPCS